MSVAADAALSILLSLHECVAMPVSKETPAHRSRSEVSGRPSERRCAQSVRSPAKTWTQCRRSQWKNPRVAPCTGFFDSVPTCLSVVQDCGPSRGPLDWILGALLSRGYARVRFSADEHAVIAGLLTTTRTFYMQPRPYKERMDRLLLERGARDLGAEGCETGKSGFFFLFFVVDLSVYLPQKSMFCCY